MVTSAEGYVLQSLQHAGDVFYGSTSQRGTVTEIQLLDMWTATTQLLNIWEKNEATPTNLTWKKLQFISIAVIWPGQNDH